MSRKAPSVMGHHACDACRNGLTLEKNKTTDSDGAHKRIPASRKVCCFCLKVKACVYAFPLDGKPSCPAWRSVYDPSYSLPDWARARA